MNLYVAVSIFLPQLAGYILLKRQYDGSASFALDAIEHTWSGKRVIITCIVLVVLYLVHTRYAVYVMTPAMASAVYLVLFVLSFLDAWYTRVTALEYHRPFAKSLRLPMC